MIDWKFFSYFLDVLKLYTSVFDQFWWFCLFKIHFYLTSCFFDYTLEPLPDFEATYPSSCKLHRVRFQYLKWDTFTNHPFFKVISIKHTNLITPTKCSKINGNLFLIVFKYITTVYEHSYLKEFMHDSKISTSITNSIF